MRETLSPELVSVNDFLSAIYGQISDGEYRHVCSKRSADSTSGWSALTYTEQVNLPAGNNNYYSTSLSYSPTSRTKGTFARLRVLVADDVDAPWELPLEPSYVLETSTGNYQCGYVLNDTPDTRDVAKCSEYVKSMKSGGDVDGHNPVRWVRLPKAINNKSKYPAPFKTRLIEWRPELRYDAVSVAKAFGYTGVPETPKSRVEARETPFPSIPKIYPISETIVSDVKSALDYISPDISYDNWILLGASLKSMEESGYGGAFGLWIDWCSKYGQQREGYEPETKWTTFTNPAASYKSILAMAQKAGWRNPAKGKPLDAPKPSTTAEELRKVYDYSTEKMGYVEYVIDGFLSNKIAVIAGFPGVGKTSTLVPLAMEAAHLSKTDSALRPVLRRKVIYITEDAGQVSNTLAAMRLHCCPHISDAEMREWFIVEHASRRSPEELALLTKTWVDEYSYIDPDRNGYTVRPLVVLDTSNATINLDSENDNAEVGRAVAAIKEHVREGAVWIVAHVSKAIGRDDVKSLSARGASAFEGDANATAYLISDEEISKNARWLVLGKRRFQANFEEIRIDTEVGEQTVETPWGVPQTIRYRYGTPSVPMESRESAKETAKQLSDEIKMRDDTRLALSAIRDAGFMKKGDIRELIDGREAYRVSVTTALEKGGYVAVRKEGTAQICSITEKGLDFLANPF